MTEDGAKVQVAAVADRLWDDMLELWPLIGTSVGDDRADDRLDDLGEDGRADQERRLRHAADAAAAIERTSLADDDRAMLDIVDAITGRGLAQLHHRLDRLQAANHLAGPATTLGDVASLQLADTSERLDRYVGRLRSFPTYLEQAAQVVREGVDTGVVPPRVVAERTVAALDRLLALDVHESPALIPVADGSDADRDRVIAAVREAVNPAHESFAAMLRDELLPHATETIGITALPGGDALYATEIFGWTSLPLDPLETHELGLERFAAIQQERHEVAASLGYSTPAEGIAAHTASGANTATTPEQLVAMAEDQVRRSWEVAPSFFGMLPSANCQVRRVEEFREADSPFAFYLPPTEDGSRPGTYYINAYDLPDRALHHVASVTYHESNPGHHFQIAIEQEMAGRPPLRRFGAGMASGAFVEGWGLYAERLADEMDLYLDGWERLGLLDNQAHRAARLVTDTGIHALGWSRERSITLLEDGGQTHTDAVIEIDRYIALPGQALCYMIGLIEIERAREASTTGAHDAASLRAFHDRVLSLGQLPLPSFRRVFGTG